MTDFTKSSVIRDLNLALSHGNECFELYHLNQRKIDTLQKAIEVINKLHESDQKLIDAQGTENFMLSVQLTSYKDNSDLLNKSLLSSQSQYEKEQKRKKNWRKVSCWSIGINVGLAAGIYLLVK